MMKRLFLLSIFLFPALFVFSQSTPTDTDRLHEVRAIDVNKSYDFKKLLPEITKSGSTPRQKLQLVYFWIYTHIDFDLENFLKNDPLPPQSTQQILKSGKGTCYEYNALLAEACNYLHIPGYDIEGYVKYYGFSAGQPFTHQNHIWRVIYIEDQWLMADVLWASGTLSIKNGIYTFNKALHPEYFLTPPADFLTTHLPADPIWQFENKPLSVEGFSAKAIGIDDSKRLAYINYADSIAVMNKLPSDEREIRSALRAYAFNPADIDDIFITYYNQAVSQISKRPATKKSLAKAYTYFSAAKKIVPKLATPALHTLLGP